MHCCLMFVSILFAGYNFVMVALDRFLFISETKKVVAGPVRQVVVLCSNDCVGSCLDEWLSYRGGLLNMFDCNFEVKTF